MFWNCVFFLVFWLIITPWKNSEIHNDRVYYQFRVSTTSLSSLKDLREKSPSKHGPKMLDEEEPPFQIMDFVNEATLLSSLFSVACQTKCKASTEHQLKRFLELLSQAVREY
jgi:hypothetical protein